MAEKELRSPLSGSEYRRLVQMDDRVIGGFCVGVFGVILLNRENPSWNIPWALALWASFLAGQLAISQVTLRSGNFARIELLRLLVGFVTVVPLYIVTGGAETDFWLGFGVMSVGSVTVYIANRFRGAVPVFLFSSVYLVLYLATARRWDAPVLARGFGQFGFLVLLTKYLVSTMDQLLANSNYLIEQQDRFNQLANNMFEVFYIASANLQKMIYVSPGYEHIWGRSCQSVYDRPISWFESIHEEDRPEAMKTLARNPGDFEMDFRIVRPDGAIRWIRDRSFAIRDSQGAVIRIGGIAHDITAERLAAIQLEQQRSMLIQSAKLSSLGEMAGGVAHEINNPLAIIQGKASQLLARSRNGSLTPAQVEAAAAKIEATSARIADIIKGLMAFAREGEQEPFRLTSLLSIVKDTLAFCEARFHHHSIELQVPGMPDDLTLECRPIQVSQVLLNLLNNAFDAVAPARDKRVRIRFEERAAEVAITVEDSGPGVAAENRDRVLEPFFTTKPQGKGTGLGLSISKGIVESHHGRLVLEEGAPTRFSIILPKSQSAAVSDTTSVLPGAG